MQSSTIYYITNSLGLAAPFLLVYFVAFILAIVFIKRAFLPSILTLLAVIGLVAIKLARIGFTAFLIETGRHDLRFILDIGMVSVDVIATSCLVAAIFVGRRNQSE